MNRKVAAFSLVELMVTLSVLTLILAIALPAVGAIVQGGRERSSYELLVLAFASARLESVRAGSPVTVCPSNDGSTCRGDDVWTQGWIVYDDPGRSPQPKNGEAVLHRFNSIGKGLRLRSTAGRTLVRFTPSGWAYGSNVSVRLCGPDGYLGSVIVNIAGRARTERQLEPAPCPFVAE
ncbi:MAG: GspH/FimT family pseudopilin [Pseudomonas sp.]